MTNESAISMVYDMTDNDIVYQHVARVFLCEDILSYDVDNWVNIGEAEIIEDFARLMSEAIDDHINQRVNNGADKYELVAMKESTVQSFNALQHYFTIRKAVLDKMMSER